MTWVIHCYAVLAIVSNSYPPLQGRLPTRYSPVRNSSKKSKLLSSAFYLHVLGTPPAFVLSQDQTLSFNLSSSLRLFRRLVFSQNYSRGLFFSCLVFSSAVQFSMSCPALSKAPLPERSSIIPNLPPLVKLFLKVF